MTAICLLDGKTWSITYQWRSGLRYRHWISIITFFISWSCHAYFSTHFCFPLARLSFNLSTIYHLIHFVTATFKRPQVFCSLRFLFIIYIEIFRPEIRVIGRFWFQHFTISCRVQPLTIQCSLNEELIKCILCYSSRPGQLIEFFFLTSLYCKLEEI